MTTNSDRNLKTGNTHPGGWATRLVYDRRMMVLIVLLVVVAGLSSVTILPRMEDPVLNKRVAIVTTQLPGADATRVEALVTEKIEDRLREIEEIKELRSQSRPGISSITIELLDAITRSDEVWSKIRGKIEDASPFLPPQASRPQFDDLEVRAFARIVSVVWKEGGEPDFSVLRRTAKNLQDRLQALRGTETVDRFGDPGEEVLVKVDPQRVAAMGLSTEDLAAQLAAYDAKDAAGTVRGRDLNLAVQVGNQFYRMDDVARADIRGADGRFVRLDQVADISLSTPQPLPRQARHGDLPAISLGVLIRPEVRIDQWSTAADQLLADFEKELPAGLGLAEVMNQAGYVQVRLSSLVTNLAVGGLAVCVVILVLMGWRSAIVVASALPLTILTVLFAMRVLGVPVHQMSITGLIIALGLLIDNAIVMADEVRSELSEGQSPADAVASVVRRLAVPLLGSTLTTAFAFAPIALMPGPAGEFVGSIATSVILAIFASLIFSLTVISAFAALFIRVMPGGSKQRGERGLVASVSSFFQYGITSKRLEFRYRQVLAIAFRHPKSAVTFALVLPIAGFGVAPLLPEQFFPPADRDQFHIELELDTGSSLASTRRVAERVDEVLSGEPIEQVDWYFGESAPTFYYNIIANRRGTPNFAQAIVRTGDAEKVSAMIRRLQSRLDREVADARVLVRQLEQGPPFDAPIEIRLFGPDLDTLTSLGNRMRAVLATIPQITHTRSLLGETLPRATIDVDAQSASLAGLTPRQIADQVQMSLDGRIGGTLLQETEELPVRVRTDDSSRSEVAGLRSIELVSIGGGMGQNGPAATMVPLAAVSQLSLQPQPGVIVRLNRQRMNEIGGYLVAGMLPSIALAEFQQRFEASGIVLPPGYELRYGGEASKRDDAVGNLLASVGVLMAMMLATLVLSLGSFRLAAIIGAIAALSVGLGLLSIGLGGYPFGFMAIIGTMGLIGIAINDSIVVIAALHDQHADRPTSPDELAVTVSHCTRHVIATTVTTVAGFAPLILAGGQFWPPLAVAISGGVVGATLLAIVFAPAAYRLIYCQSPLLVERQLPENRRQVPDHAAFGPAMTTIP